MERKSKNQTIGSGIIELGEAMKELIEILDLAPDTMWPLAIKLATSKLKNKL